MFHWCSVYWPLLWFLSSPPSPFPASFLPSFCSSHHTFFFCIWPSYKYLKYSLKPNPSPNGSIFTPIFSTIYINIYFSPNFLFSTWSLPICPPSSSSLLSPLTIMDTTTSPPRPTLGGLISTFVSPLPPPLLLLFLSSTLRSLSLKMVTPQSLFTLFGMFNLYYSICLSLSVNPVLFTFLQWCREHSVLISACFSPSFWTL